MRITKERAPGTSPLRPALPSIRESAAGWFAVEVAGVHGFEVGDEILGRRVRAAPPVPAFGQQPPCRRRRRRVIIRPGTARRVADAGAAIDAAAEGELYRRLAPRARLYGLRHLMLPPWLGPRSRCR